MFLEHSTGRVKEEINANLVIVLESQEQNKNKDMCVYSKG